ncbi:hypothetical protein [Arthrobacter sp. ISL-95]|uniref:hypothetical protein n=1 Tax=Arthrobacter sp. ISL-95 TaxID=2819116 RepID=UPI001BEA2908|nr:hypothetical protein [Arthrobacter sp. ISL-95]MBT2587905.1 hypothetical protein [Arthrobacter sp. ISL-95]
MRITAKQLQLRNVSQLAAVEKAGLVYMGRLDSVVSDSKFYFVNIGGTTLTLDPDHPVEIRRTSGAESLAVSVELQEDMVEGLVA